MSTRPQPDPVPDPDAAVGRLSGAQWVQGRLPTVSRPWLGEARGDERLASDLRRALSGRSWVSPGRPAYFISDPRGDADALLTSLVATGGVAKTGPEDSNLRLVGLGERTRFIIGGDVLGMGPSNLRLLRIVRSLFELGADVDLLAGNRDVGLLLALVHVGRKDPRLAHLFGRMGARAIRVLCEVFDEYLVEEWGLKRELLRIPREPRIREMLLPDETWFLDFPEECRSFMPEGRIPREVERLRERIGELERTIEQSGLSYAQLYASIERARDLFLEPGGEFSWFFQRMRVAVRHGSCLFVHAGLDDEMALVLEREGVDGLEARFRDLGERDLFSLYYGPVGNVFRTRYRSDDYPMTDAGWAAVRRAGILALVHGHGIVGPEHQLTHNGHVLQIACDTGMDRATREASGDRARGGAALVLAPDGRIRSVCAGQTHARELDLASYAGLVTVA